LDHLDRDRGGRRGESAELFDRAAFRIIWSDRERGGGVTSQRVTPSQHSSDRESIRMKALRKLCDQRLKVVARLRWIRCVIATIKLGRAKIAVWVEIDLKHSRERLLSCGEHHHL
jgi:hypothetical protein